MEKKMYFDRFIIAIALLLVVPTHSINQKDGEKTLASITSTIDTLKQKKITQNPSSDIDEIDSPTIQREKNRATKQALQSIMQDAKQLDTFISTLPRNEQATWKQKQSILLESAKPALKTAIKETITTTWQEHGKSIAQAALNLIQPVAIAAGIGIVTQALQMGTGNLLALDTNTLLITGLTSTAFAALTALSTKGEFLRSTSVATLSEALIAPSVTNYAFSLAMPSVGGPITYWITTEAIALITDTIEQGGGIGKILGTINLTQTLLPTINRNLGSPSNNLVTAALPHVQTIVRNQKIATVLTEIGWIAMQSAAVGGLLYMAGLGYADNSMTQSIGYAALTGVAQGALATVMTFGRVVSPGAILSITSAPLAQQAFVIAGGTRQGAVTAVIQATVTEVSNVLLNESKKQGGILETLKKGKSLLGQTMISRWNSTWATITDAWETIQSIEPIPL